MGPWFASWRCATPQRPLDAKTAELVVAYYPLVQRIARRAAARLPPGVEVDDLVSAGVIGLIEALGRYDPSRGVPFEVAARYRVQGAILDALRATDWVPRVVRTRGKAVERARSALTSRLGRPPTAAELAARLETSVETVHGYLADAAAQQPLSFDSHAAGDGVAPIDRVAGPDDPERSTELAQQRRSTAAATQALPERERRAIEMFYFEGQPLKVIAAELGITPSRVTQLCQQGIGRLQRLLDPPAEAREEP